MVLPAVKDQILNDLDQLSPEEQKRAAELVRQLVPALKGVSGRDLLRFVGVLDAESAREMEEAIEEGCEERLKGRRSAPELAETLMAIGRRCSALPDLDAWDADEILGYDEKGAFR